MNLTAVNHNLKTVIVTLNANLSIHSFNRCVSDRAKILFTNPHEVDGVPIKIPLFLATDLLHHPDKPDGVVGVDLT